MANSGRTDAAPHEDHEGLGERARRTLHTVEENYPHNIHPGLVPGIGVEEQRIRYGTDRVVFGVAATLIIAFIVWGITSTESLKAASDSALAWVVSNTGWLFNSLMVVVFGFMVFIGLSKFGSIPLGRDGEEPEYSKFSWVAMMFSAGVGIGLFNPALIHQHLNQAFHGPYTILMRFG